MFMPTGGGGKGNRPQSTHQQNHNHQTQHHQTSHGHSHPHHHHQSQQQQQHQSSQQQQQSRISHHHQQQQQDSQQQHQQPVFVPQQSANLGNLHHQHHTLSPQQHLQQQHQQQHQQLQQQQHHLQQPIIFYSGQPPPYASHVQHSSSSSSNGSNGGAALQLSGAASNSSLAHGHGHGHQVAANGVLTPANSNTSLVRAHSNSTLPLHFTQSAGLIAHSAGSGTGGGTTYLSTAYLPFNHPGQRISASPVAFASNGAAGAPAGGFYPAAPQQKQQLQSGQQHAGAATVAAQPQTIAYYTTMPPPPLTANNNGNNNNNNTSGGVGGSGSITHRGNMRGGQRSTPPQQATGYFTYAMPTAAAPQRPTAPAVAPILNQRNNALNGTATFHMSQSYCPSIQLGPPPSLTTTSIIAAAGLTAPPSSSSTGLHTYAPHLQSSSATAVNAVPGVSGAFSSTSLTSTQQLAGGDKVKERRHAIPIIHPETKENVLDPNSSVFVKRDSNCTLTSSTGSDSNIPQYQADTEMETSGSAVLLLSGVMVDHQMQTDKSSTQPKECDNLAPPPLTDEDKVSVIVKDILANSGNPDEHLSFWQYNDLENTADNLTDITPAGAVVNTNVPVLFKEPSSSKKLCPKSANKQITATPTSIANAVAEATGGSSTGITILASSTKQIGPQQKQQLQQPQPTNTMGEGNNVSFDSELIPGSPTKTPQQSKCDVLLPSSSSSASSTPTHQPKLQQATQMKPIAGVKATIASPDLAQTAVCSSTAGRKSQRKAQKRKEQEKKKQKAAAGIASTNTPINSSSSSINNTNNNNNSSNSSNAAKSTAKCSNDSATSGAETNITFMTTTKTTPAVAVASAKLDKAATTMTDKLSATSNNCSLSTSLRDKHPKDQQQYINSGNSNDGTGVSEIANDSGSEIKHMANEDIVAKFLQKNSDDPPNLTEPQLEFLNSSSSMCEDEAALCAAEANAVVAQSNDMEDPCSDNISKSSESNVDELKFGDFNEEAPSNTTSFICSSTWSSSQSADVTCSQTTISQDNIDCAPKLNPQKIELTSSTEFSSKKNPDVFQPENGSSNQKTVAKSSSAVKFIRYNMEELREMAKLSDSRKPPLVPCQKGDCISQLFVSRQSQQQQQQQQQQHHHGHNQHGQQYQHLHEFMDHVSGKRGRGHGHGPNKKHHDGHQNMGGNNSGNNSGGSSMGGSNQRHMDIIRVQLSLKEEIKLSECENAWQPETLRRMTMFSASEPEPDDDMENVLKKVRGILNKLTPDNFDVLLKEMSSIKMDTQAKMTNVMLLIFEKTISEPNFAPTYARFCKVLFHEIKAENKSLFTSSLITRIQHEFESNVNDANAKAKKLQPTQDRINACTDTAKKAEIRAEMEDLEYQFRRRAWGTVRFIGELFKLQSLTSDRVLHCVESLLEHGCEEKLEYMCKLLTTVGHLLEAGSVEQFQSGARIEKIFRKIQDIVHRSRTNPNSNRQHQINIKISSRVRFMMQDVLDLRSRNYDQPVTTHSAAGNRQRHKQQDDTKTSQQQQQQQQQHSGRSTHQQQQQSNYQYQQQKQQHHHHHGHDGANYFMQKMPKTQQHENQALSIDPNKLRFSNSSNDEVTAKLGNSSHYQWRNASNRPVSAAPSGTPSLLKRVSPASNSSYPSYQQPSSAVSTTQGGNRNNNVEPSTSDINLEPKYCQELLTKLVEEALSSRDWHGEVLVIWRNLIAKQQQATSVIYYVLTDYVHRVKVRRQQRLACANVFGYLMQQEAFDKTIFNQAYTRFSEEFPDILVDVPNGWTYVFEFLGPIMHEGRLDLKDVWQHRWLDGSQFTERFVRAFVSYFVHEFGAGYAHKMWHVDNKLDRGQMFWSDTRKYRDFLQSNSFQFLEPNSTGTVGMQRSRVTRTPAEHVERISYLLNLSSDTAIDYINTNVHINAIFVRQLTKFLCCDYALTVVTNSKSKSNNNNNNQNINKSRLQLNVESFRSQCTPLLRLCIDAQEAHEVACIEETVDSLLQHFTIVLEDEMAAGETICNTLSVLYDCEVISKDSFEKWFKREIEQSTRYRRSFVDKVRAFIKEM